MADGKPLDLQEYVLRSGVRSGLKREFAFALQSQAELSNSLGRTRSCTASMKTPADPPSCGRKIPKVYDDRDKQLAIILAPPVGLAILALPAENPMDDNCSASGGAAVGIPNTDVRNNRYPKGGVGVSISAHSKKNFKKDVISSNTPVFTEGIGKLKKDKIRVEKSNTKHRKPISEGKLGNSKASTPSPFPLESVAVVRIMSKSQLENGSVAEQSKVLDGCNGSKISNSLEEKPIRRFTRSALKLIPVAAAPPKIEQEAIALKLIPVAADPPKIEQEAIALKLIPVAVDPPKIEQEAIPGEVKPVRRFTRSTKKLTFPAAPSSLSNEQKNQGNVLPVAEIPLTVQQENLVEIPILVDNCVGLNFEIGQLDESIKAEHEGSVSVAIISGVDEGDGMYDVFPLEKPTMTPTWRFTRSLLMEAVEKSAAADGLTLTNVGSVESEDSNGDSDTLNESPTSTSKKKMELKMFKKITLTKFPSNVRQLLGTRLLEGLPVKYISCPGKNAGLQGIIMGNGVLCSCTSCQGKRVVSAYQFEIHAGSTKKHPSDFIFLQNGKSLREVLKSCAGASLDMLEAAIHNAIGPLPPMKLSLCQKCQESFDTARSRNFLFCNSCIETSLQQATPTPSHGMTSSVKLPRRVLVHFPSAGAFKSLSSQKKPSFGKLTRKDVGLHKLVFMDDILPQGTEVGYYVRGKRLLEGYIKDSGIFCGCCNSVVSPSQFEAHAGQASRRKPYNNIYTSNGVSLHELSISLSKGRKLLATENDDLCGICSDGGDLLLCDICPRAFHKECIGLSGVPIGDWFCQYCQNLQKIDKCLANNDNAIAAGRVAGVDPIEQIIKRCIRIVATPENDAGVCALCRQHDFSRSGFDGRTVIICDQCETEYHVGCLKDHGMADLQVLPEGEWFCRPDCSRIHAALHELLRQGPEALDANIIKKKLDEKGLSADATADVRWQLLSDKSDSADSKVLLSQAVSIFRESFDPIVDPISGLDLVPFMVYGRNIRDQDFGGVYCMVLTVKSSVISAGLLRVLGREVAELPLVATKKENQGLGYFQSLFSCIESLFESLKVKHFVLPAADEAESMWTKKFGFAKLSPSQLREYANGARPIMFQGTSMLHKLVGHQVVPPLPADNGPELFSGMDLMMDVSDCYFITFKFGEYWIEARGQSRRRYKDEIHKTVKLERDKINFVVLREQTQVLCPWLRGHYFDLHYYVNRTSSKVCKPITSDGDVRDMLTHYIGRSRIEMVIVVYLGEEDSQNIKVKNGNQLLVKKITYLGKEDSTPSNSESGDNDNMLLDAIDNGFLICQHEESKSLSVGIRFQDSISFKEVLRTTAILNSFDVKIKVSDKTRVIATCAHQGCPWRVRAALCSDGQSFEVRKLDATHLCPGGVNRYGNKQATINWVAHQIKDIVKNNPCITPKQINSIIESTYGLSLPYMKLWRSREQARDMIFGSFDDNNYRYKMTYDGAISTLPGKDRTNAATDGFQIGAPNCLRPPRDRSKKRRIKSCIESTKNIAKNVHKCSRCGLAGHYKSTCVNTMNIRTTYIDRATHSSSNACVVGLRPKLPIRRDDTKTSNIA